MNVEEIMASAAAQRGKAHAREVLDHAISELPDYIADETNSVRERSFAAHMLERFNQAREQDD